MSEIHFSEATLDQLAQRICGAHGNASHPAAFSWPQFPYRTGPKLQVFFERDCGLQNVPTFGVPPATGTRITYAKEVLHAVVEGTVTKSNFSHDQVMLWIIERLLKSVAQQPERDHLAAAEEMNQVLASDGLTVTFANGGYIFQYAPPNSTPLLRVALPGTEGPLSGDRLVPVDSSDYDRILEVIQYTAVMFERSPGTYRAMTEEDLRQVLLTTLNSHYPGQATGETFNSGGKTDILVRRGDKTIFIAECKIWRGSKALIEAVDQLLGYTSWRDTKTAILLFHRGKELSRVIDQIPAVLTEHPQFKRKLPYAGETGFRCVLANRNDPNREITLTVLAFDVPA